MADRSATKEEVAAWQKAKAKVDTCAQLVDQATRQKEVLDDTIVRETYLKERYDQVLADLIAQLGGTPTPPAPGTSGDWTIKA